MKKIKDILRKGFRRIFSFGISTIIILLISASQLMATTNETFNSGAYIINMGVTPQTINNGLKPYGLVYHLIVDEHVPVRWAIDPNKSKDGVDFSVDGNSYKGGSFIIPVEYLSGDVLALITTWQDNGNGVVVVGPTVNSFTAPIYKELTSWPRAVLDDQNDQIVTPYYANAGVPSSSYQLAGNPTNLTGCNDVYVLPHADPFDWDPLWQTALINFVKNEGGYLWSGCHAVSALEGMVSGANFLTTNGLIPWECKSDWGCTYSGDKNDPPYGHHDASSSEFVHTFHGNPIMQFMGRIDDATRNGSEQIYLPKLNSAWNTLTSVAVYNTDQIDLSNGHTPGEAALLVYGHAFGNTNYGMVMYEGGHKFNDNHFGGPDGPANIAAQRSFFNFILMAGVDKEITATSNVPATVVSGATINISASGSNGSIPYSYEWSSTCAGGTFFNSTSASTTYTAPIVATNTTCVITVVVTDACGRFSFESTSVTVTPPVGPTAVNDAATTPMNTPVDITELANDNAGSAALDPTSVGFVGALPNPLTEGEFSIDGTTGLVTFTPFVTFVGTVAVNYEVCDLNSLCDIATIVVTVTPVSGPTAVDDNATTTLNTAVDIDVLDNDTQGAAALDPTSVSFVATTLPDPVTEGEFSVDGTTGLVTFTPVTGFLGTVTVDYNICDLNTLCDVATITVEVTATPPTAVDDNANTTMNIPVDIDVLDNDTPGDAPIDPTTVSFIGGTAPDPTDVGTFTVDGTTGLVTFTPVYAYAGPATIDYQVCDDNGLCATATISVFIANGPDTDGDGAPDIIDDYPADPLRAFDNYYPAGGNGTLAYEDLWPGQGDYDFNDLIIDYRFMTVTSATNHIVETFGTFIVKAFGASLENGFGFQLANSNIADADITSVTGYDLQEGYIVLAANGIEEGQTIPTIIVYDNAFNILTHPGSGIGVNTSPGSPYVEPDTLNIFMQYNQGTYTLAELDIPNFNPFLIVDLNRSIEIHLPDYLPTDKADQSLYGTINDDSNPATGKYYKTVNNLPWAIHITEPFEYPIEKTDITAVYLKFKEWAESGGQLYQDWYRDEPGYRNSSLIYTHN